MAVNILIGVGGTGAKTVEAALVLLLSGMVDDPVYVGLVDQDKANGNVARAITMLTRAHRFRKLWSSGENGIEWNKAGTKALGGTRIIPLFSGDTMDETDAIYQPNAAEVSLQKMMGPADGTPQRALFDLLFQAGGQEQDLKLDKGYRGRAHVGSAAFIASLAEDGNKLFDAIEDIAANAQGQAVNVFFVGSAFGGTGAAGFPTLARRLDRLRKDATYPNGKNVKIGGLLMLPYFLFNNPDDADAAVVKSEHLLPKTQLALEYYHNLFEHEQCFDMFYTMGWDTPYPLGYHEPGSAEQANPALPAELLSATAAIDFFRKMAENPDVERTKVHMSARNAAQITWSDLPCAEPHQREYQNRLGQLLRFAIYWRYYFAPHLQKPVGGLFKTRNWAQKIAGKSHPADASEMVKALDDLIASILNWGSTIEAMASRVRGGQALWHMGPFLDQRHDPNADAKTPAKMANLPDGALDVYGQDDFNALIEKPDSGEMGRSGEILFEELHNAESHRASLGTDNHSGLGKAVMAVFNAARLN